MFGVVKGICGAEKKQWMGHICGLCLTLRDTNGQLARIATSYDAALLSVMVTAQQVEAPVTYDHTCPLRAMQKIPVLANDNLGSQYAASMALLMAGTRVQDNVLDGDGWLGRLPKLGMKLGQAWQIRGKRIGLSTRPQEAIQAQVAYQAEREQELGQDFRYYARPTEEAVGVVMGETAVLTHQPDNQPHLEKIGRMFGRIMYLLDAYKDYEADMQAGKFNPLLWVEDRTAYAQKTFRHAYAQLKRAYGQLTLTNGTLLHRLLITQLQNVGQKALGGIRCTSCSCGTLGSPSNLLDEEEIEEQKGNRGSRLCCFDGCYCGDCGSCDVCCCDCDCCEVDCCDGELECCDCDCNCCGCGEIECCEIGCCDCGGGCCGCCCDCDGCDCDCG